MKDDMFTKPTKHPIADVAGKDKKASSFQEEISNCLFIGTLHLD